MEENTERTAAIIGGGPAGLMAAEVLSFYGVQVTIYEQMPTVGRKFLMAGKSGLNLTKDEPLEKLLSFYDNKLSLRPHLKRFGSEAVKGWAEGLGQEVFTGSTGRVFPTVMKASPLLRAWIARLTDYGVTIKTRHTWQGWQDDNLIFASADGEVQDKPDVTVLALGGGSWARLGSDGAWTDILKNRDLVVNAFKPSNCGFDVNWSDFMVEKFGGMPVKNIRLSVSDQQTRGDFVVTKNGVEGGAIYMISAALRDHHGPLMVDLMPDMTYKKLVSRLHKPRGKKSMAEHLRKTIHLTGVKAALLREFAPDCFDNMGKIAKAIKELPIPITAPRPIDEAISTAGGLDFAALKFDLSLQDNSAIFCAGEMLDWDAPTGGYLLTACLATGFSAAQNAAEYLDVVPEAPEEAEEETAEATAPKEDHDWRSLIDAYEDGDTDAV